MSTGVIYTGRDNAPVLVFEDDAGTYDLSAATKIAVTIAGQTFDTVGNPGSFDVSDLVNGRLGLKLGQAGITAGRYPVTVDVYSVLEPNGWTWADADDLVPVFTLVV